MRYLTTAPHACGMCGHPIVFTGWGVVGADVYAEWVCERCDWEHISKDCCESSDTVSAAGRTIDGHPVTIGMDVWNYNLDPDMVMMVDHVAQDGTVWYRTIRGIFDSKRLWVRHPNTGRKATS